MPRSPKIYPLDFNTSGSATIRLFGRILEVKIHQAAAKLPLHRMICVNSIIDSESCSICQTSCPSSSRYLAYGWDCNAKRWAFYLAPMNVFKEIFEECRKIGVTEVMTDVGHGPDVFVQKIGFKTEIAIAGETAGKERGPGGYPKLETVLESVKKQSIWNEFQTVDEVEAEYPKDIPPAE